MADPTPFVPGKIAHELPQMVNAVDFRVLIVDDSEYMLKLLRSFLNVLGVRDIRTAGDSESARKILSAWPAQLVITDLKMKPVSGLDLIRMVRGGKDTKNPEVPIIVVTGFADIETVKLVRSVGATGILVKPVSLDALRERVMPMIAAAQTAAAPQPFSNSAA